MSFNGSLMKTFNSPALIFWSSDVPFFFFKYKKRLKILHSNLKHGRDGDLLHMSDMEEQKKACDEGHSWSGRTGLDVSNQIQLARSHRAEMCNDILKIWAADCHEHKTYKCVHLQNHLFSDGCVWTSSRTCPAAPLYAKQLHPCQRLYIRLHHATFFASYAAWLVGPQHAVGASCSCRLSVPPWQPWALYVAAEQCRADAAESRRHGARFSPMMNAFYQVNPCFGGMVQRWDGLSATEVRFQRQWGVIFSRKYEGNMIFFFLFLKTFPKKKKKSFRTVTAGSLRFEGGN